MTDEPLDLTEIAGDVDSLCLDLGHHALLAEVKRLRAQLAALHGTDRRPHSRACGYAAHPHGPLCHPNCPTCDPITNPTPEDP